MLLFINSETLLFIAYLWIIFNYLWICNINSILLPDPIELTFSNTLLLSITTTCLCIYSLTTSIFILNIYLYCTYLLGLLFLFIQIYEYQLLYFYISDSFFTSSFYLITGLHFSHVIIGIVLLSFVFTSLYNIKLFYLNIQLFYWHFVEIIWLVLYIVFYSSFIVHDIVVQGSTVSISISIDEFMARALKQEHQTLTLGLEPTYHTLYLPMHIHTYTCPSNPKVGKCTR